MYFNLNFLNVWKQESRWLRLGCGKIKFRAKSCFSAHACRKKFTSFFHFVQIFLSPSISSILLQNHFEPCRKIDKTSQRTTENQYFIDIVQNDSETAQNDGKYWGNRLSYSTSIELRQYWASPLSAISGIWKFISLVSMMKLSIFVRSKSGWFHYGFFIGKRDEHFKISVGILSTPSIILGQISQWNQQYSIIFVYSKLYFCRPS